MEETKVTKIRLPICNGGFRSGWATAEVNGVRMRIYTSRSAYTDYTEHVEDIRKMFEQGKGEKID